jgi:class 3 adenylate cyclase
LRRSVRTIIFLCILGAGIAGTVLDWSRPLDLKLLDLQFKLLRDWAPRPLARDIVVVGIDEQTAKALPEPLTLWHKHLGKFLHIMAQAKPAAVGIDIVLPDRSYDAVAPGSDGALLRGILEARHVYPLVLALTVDPSGKPRHIHRAFVTAAGDGATGFALFPVDPDGIVRRFDEHLADTPGPVPTLAGQIARKLGVEPRTGIIDYSRGDAFGYIPLYKLLELADAGRQDVFESVFRNKVVMLGTVLPFADRQRLPVQLASWDRGAYDTPGVLLQAQTLRNILDGNLIQPVSRTLAAALTVAMTLLWFVAGSTTAVVAVLGAVLAVLLAGATGLVMQGWFLPVTGAMMTAVLAHAGRHLYETVLKLRERRRLRSVFSGYVSPGVMQEILAGKLQPELGGASKHVCVMFSDIRGYTTRSENMSPEAIVGFLNSYFEDIVALIHEHGGTVVCFMGDGIMAVFGAPNPLDNPCSNAFEAGRKMLEHVAEFNARHRAEGEAPVEIGVGLHAGEAVIGHIGSSSRHDYTAIGDVTNVASRLEGLTKEAGFRLVCSKTVAESLGAADQLTYLGPMAIKGHTPVEVYGHHKA